MDAGCEIYLNSEFIKQGNIYIKKGKSRKGLFGISGFPESNAVKGK